MKDHWGNPIGDEQPAARHVWAGIGFRQSIELGIGIASGRPRRPFSARLITLRRCLRAATANSSRWASTGLLSVSGRRATSTRPPTPEH